MRKIQINLKWLNSYKQTLENFSYVTTENFTELIKFSGSNKTELLKLINENANNSCSHRSSLCRRAVHTKKKHFIIKVLSAPELSKPMVYNTDYQPATLSKEQTFLLEELSSKFSSLFPNHPIFLDLYFYIDKEETRTQLYWHQDVWNTNLKSPDILLFWVIDRDLSKCKMCSVPTYNESHPKVMLPLASTDEDHRHLFFDTYDGSRYFPNENHSFITQLEEVPDVTDAGYIIDQRVRIGISPIIHSRTAQKDCHSTRTTMVARLDLLDVDITSLTDKEAGDKLELFAKLYLKFNQNHKFDSKVLKLTTQAAEKENPDALSRLAESQLHGTLGNQDS